ncbi:hypothetical protein BSKO_10515 [Bryopsis sp. KO-2023]|nr:hypothetical protein BSKO_10515 [Bryopsis sp. KO-2023]
MNGLGPKQVDGRSASVEEILNGLPASENLEADLEDSDLRWEGPRGAVKSVGNSRASQPEVEEANHARWAIPVSVSLALVLPVIVFVVVFCYYIFTFDFTSEERDANGLPSHRHSVRRTVASMEVVHKTSPEIQCGVIIVCNTTGPDGEPLS